MRPAHLIGPALSDVRPDWIAVTDATDERLDDFRDLADAERRPDRRGVVIAEGASVVRRLLTSPYPVRAVVGVAAKLAELDLRTATSAPAYVVDKWVLSDVVGYRVTRGVMAAADRPPTPSAAELLGAGRTFAVLEGLNDFENLGALFRNAAAFGVDAVLLDPRTADPLYRRSVRVSMGHVLNVPFARLPGSWPDSLDEVRAAGVRVLALDTGGPATLGEVAVPPRWAVLLGAEGPGLTPEARNRADLRVRIPMAAGVDSLNVATAAAIAFAHLSGSTGGTLDR